MSRRAFLRPLPPPPAAPPPTATGAGATTKSFNAAINHLSSQGLHRHVLYKFSSMLTSNTPLDAHSYPNLFKACTFLNKFSLGISLHQRVIVDGFSSDSYISSSLINFYAKFGCLNYARYVFDEMPERNVVPWTAIIGCYSRFGDVNNAFYMYNLMQNEGVRPSSVTVLSLLSGVCEIHQLECLHANGVKLGLDFDLHLGNCMLSLYGKLGRVSAATQLFEAMDERDIVSWNSLISGYAQVKNLNEILWVLSKMQIENVFPDQQTFGALLMSVDLLQSDVELGGLRLIHGQIVRSGLEIDAPMATSLIGLYMKYANVRYANKVFEMIVDKDVILWTSMISGLVQNDCAYNALNVFTRMLDSGLTPSSATVATVLAACAKISSLKLGTSVHGFLLRQGMPLDIPVKNSLISMYSKCGCLTQSSFIFHNMYERDVVSWNAIVAGYAQKGYLSEALSLFNEMRSTLQKPDFITVVSLFQACASTGALQQGKWVHNFVTKTVLSQPVMIGTGLVDMYSKCGDLETALKCFNQMSEHDIVSWSTIITAYGSHGKGEMALELYSEFLKTGLAPNHVIFLSVLFACSHNGLVHAGLNMFKSMVEDFHIAPELEHRACIVDLLCRSGRLEEAYEFFKETFSDPPVDILGILLDACRAKGNAKLGEIICRDIIKMKPICAEKYVQIAHSYALMNRWDEVGDAWIQMKSLGLKKIPGWSYIEEQGKITTFFNDQSSHPQYEDIMSVMEILSHEMRDFRLRLDNRHVDTASFVI